MPVKAWRPPTPRKPGLCDPRATEVAHSLVPTASRAVAMYLNRLALSGRRPVVWVFRVLGWHMSETICNAVKTRQVAEKTLSVVARPRSARTNATSVTPSAAQCGREQESKPPHVPAATTPSQQAHPDRTGTGATLLPNGCSPPGHPGRPPGNLPSRARAARTPSTGPPLPEPGHHGQTRAISRAATHSARQDRWVQPASAGQHSLGITNSLDEHFNRAQSVRHATGPTPAVAGARPDRREKVGGVRFVHRTDPRRGGGPGPTVARAPKSVRCCGPSPASSRLPAHVGCSCSWNVNRVSTEVERHRRTPLGLAPQTPSRCHRSGCTACITGWEVPAAGKEECGRCPRSCESWRPDPSNTGRSPRHRQGPPRGSIRTTDRRRDNRRVPHRPPA